MNDQHIRPEKVRCRYGGILIRGVFCFSPLCDKDIELLHERTGENLKAVM